MRQAALGANHVPLVVSVGMGWRCATCVLGGVTNWTMIAKHVLLEHILREWGPQYVQAAPPTHGVMLPLTVASSVLYGLPAQGGQEPWGVCATRGFTCTAQEDL